MKLLTVLFCLLFVVDAIVNRPQQTSRDCGASWSITERRGPSTSTEACWQVALVNSQLQYVCSGALIDPSWLIIPAHCLYRNVLERETFDVMTSVEANQNVTNSQKRRVVRRYIHHMHSERFLNHDIALLKLETPVELNADTCIICLPRETQNIDEREECLASGFVFRSRGITPNNPLFAQEAMFNMNDQSTCNRTTLELKPSPANSFCVYFRDAHREHVQSRAVLACKSPIDDRFEITGLLIKGVGFEKSNVFILVSKYVEWIRLRLSN